MIKNTSFDVEKFGEFFPHIEDILQFGVYTYASNGSEITWSDGVYDLLGIERNSISSNIENFYKFVHEEDAERLRSSVRESIASRQPYKIEFSITDGHGHFKRVYAENYMKFDSNGELVEYTGLLKNVTEKYLNKKSLELKIEQLDKSNNNLQEFVYVASHDLQEPLRKISTFSERLQDKYGHELNEEGRLYVNRILASCQGMQTLLEDLLDFSRLSFVNKTFEKVCMQDLITDVLNDLEMKIDESKAQVLCKDLPEIEVYPSQIRQLFNNLIGNSIKFRKPSEQLVINVDCHEYNFKDYPQLPLEKNMKYVKIQVKDNGIGFDQEFSQRIFMIFQRLHGKVEYQGSGIGLAICKKIVENHNGFIFADGTPGGGASFTILLPETQTQS